MQHIPADLSQKLKGQWRLVGEGSDEDDAQLKFWVKIFNPSGGETWWICEQNPDRPNELFGYMTGCHCPEWCYISLAELQSIKGPLGIGLERDLYFEPLSVLAFKTKLADGTL